jgi:hypothetical protein
MADAMKNGDPRMPPLDPTPKPEDKATAAELADPKLYARIRVASKYAFVQRVC